MKAGQSDLRGRCLSDFRAQGMLHASTIRAPCARGRVVEIQAPHLPRGYSMLDARDIPGSNHILSFGAEVPIFASSRISWKGEPVGLVVGPDPALADELAAAAKVRCEEEEPFLVWESFSSAQTLAKRVVREGDPESAFASSGRIDSATYRTDSQEHFYSEPMGAAAFLDYDKMAVVCATQWPYHVRDSVSLALACTPGDVSVRPSELGLHLDGKLWYPSLVACQAAVAAKACSRPVRILYTRQEDFRFSPKRARCQIGIRSALDGAGRLAALDIRLVVNVGAYGPLAEEILDQAVLAAGGMYRCPNIRIEGYAVATNTPPLGGLGGLGSSHSFFAVEAYMNRVAKAAGEDPAEWKSLNLVRRGDRLFGSAPLAEDVPVDRIRTRLETLAAYGRKYASYELVRKRTTDPRSGVSRGIAMAVAFQSGVLFLKGTGSNTYAVEATLEKDLRLVLRTSAAAGSEGLARMWSRTAAEMLGIHEEAVEIGPAGTDSAPNSGPVTLSRGVVTVNRLVERCCRAIQKRRFRDPLPLTARSVIRISNSLHWEEGRLVGTPLDTASWGGAVVEVEIDDLTMRPRPIGVWLVADGGRIVNPDRAMSVLRTGIVDALGSCVRETLDPGSDEGDAYFRYSLPAMSDMPPIVAEFLAPDRKAPARGVGDLPFNLVPAAFLAAVSQATGVEFNRLPLAAADIVRVLEAQ